MSNPILAEKRFEENGVRYLLRVLGGLHYMSGNARPYFSITGELFRNGRLDSCGCMHETIESHFPGRFTDLIRIHLSEDTGVPMHAAGNGLYWLAGAARELQGYGQSFHGSNDSSAKTPEECMAIALDHLRVTPEEIAPLLEKLRITWEYSRLFPTSVKNLKEALTKDCEAFCKGRRAAWEAEARAVIASHRLEVYGDKWTGGEEPR